ncbi:MAG TPA: hypothetical protein DCM38_14525 [Gammaproteobacteria bacterium]|nr:hypothetical protein [Gammaproteobacteria bacterium]
MIVETHQKKCFSCHSSSFYQLSVISYQLSVISYQLSVISCQGIDIHYVQGQHIYLTNFILGLFVNKFLAN